jgi:Glycosyl transferase family 2
MPVGHPTAVFCIGTCFHRDHHVAELTITAGGMRHRSIAQGMPRLDRFRALHPTLTAEEVTSEQHDPHSPGDPELRSYRSGFWAIVPVRPGERPGHLELRIEARLEDGTTASAALGSIAIAERPGPALNDHLRAGEKRPTIAICMATYNPDMELFRVQVDSIRRQTDPDWVCLISDDCSEPEHYEAIAEIVAGDGRFVLSRAEEHLSFYRNFERALGMIPPGVELVALCDHDDRWYPEKLETLREALGPAELVYSDLRRVDAAGRVRANTLWEGRRNNHTNLASLLISNTIPGAACLFRRRVIERALPFPDGPGWDFHDHWLALVAMSLGKVAYVDRPLYDYVQHPGAVLGRVASDGGSSSSRRPPVRPASHVGRHALRRWRSAYFSLYLQRVLQAQTLLSRCRPELTTRKRRALQLLSDAGCSPLAFAWLALRPARTIVGRNETLGIEELLVKGILWRHLIALRIWGRERRSRSLDDARMPPVDPGTLGPRQRRWLGRR